jgi:hypothetical protein
MSARRRPTDELRKRFNAGIELVKDGVDPYLALELVLWPSKAVEQASAGELPPGWNWTSEGERKNELHQRQRDAYWAKKKAK